MIFSSKKQTEKIKSLEKQLEESQKALLLSQTELNKERDKTKKLTEQLNQLKSEGEKQASAKAEAIIEEARQKYEKEITRLRIFVKKWQSALPEPKDITPESRKSAINGGNAEEGGFNLEEVLNPGSELDLATLCKELGVMD